MLHYRSAVAFQEEKLRQAVGPTGNPRRVDTSGHGTRRVIAAALLHRLVNTVTRLWITSSGLIRRVSWNQTE